MIARFGAVVLPAAMLAVMLAVVVLSYLPPPAAWAWAALAALVVLGAAGAAVALSRSPLPPRPRMVDVVCATAATAATLVLSRDLGIPGLVAASLVLVALGVAVRPGRAIDEQASRAGYAGVFVGLISPDVTIWSGWVVLAGATAGVLWGLIGAGPMTGIGGRIGLVGFMASALAYWIADVLGDRGGALLLPPDGGLAEWVITPVGCAAALIGWVLFTRTTLPLVTVIGLPSLAVCGAIAMSDMGQPGVALASAWFGGMAIAATTGARLPHAGWIAVAGLVYGGMMVRYEGPLQGHVGVLGVVATIAVLATMGARWALQRWAPRLPGQTGVP